MARADQNDPGRRRCAAPFPGILAVEFLLPKIAAAMYFGEPDHPVPVLGTSAASGVVIAVTATGLAGIAAAPLLGRFADGSAVTDLVGPCDRPWGWGVSAVPGLLGPAPYRTSTRASRSGPLDVNSKVFDLPTARNLPAWPARLEDLDGRIRPIATDHRSRVFQRSAKGRPIPHRAHAA